jgi:hypothetical protein
LFGALFTFGFGRRGLVSSQIKLIVSSLMCASFLSFFLLNRPDLIDTWTWPFLGVSHAWKGTEFLFLFFFCSHLNWEVEEGGREKEVRVLFGRWVYYLLIWLEIRGQRRQEEEARAERVEIISFIEMKMDVCWNANMWELA